MTEDANRTAAAGPSHAEAAVSRVAERPWPFSAQLALTLAVAAAVVSLVVLIGWAIGSHPLEMFWSDVPPAKANGAVMVLLLSLAVALRVVADNSDPGARFRRAVTLAAFVVAAAAFVFAAATLYEYVANVNLGIDEMLFNDGASVPAAPYPGRPSVPVVIAVLLACPAVPLLRARIRGIHPSQLLGIVVGALAGFSLLGYLYGVNELVTLGSPTQASLPTTIALLLLGIALVAANPNHGLVRQLGDPGIAGQVARRTLPAAIVVLPLVGFLRLQAERAALLSTAAGVTAMIALAALILLIVMAWTSARLLQLESERSQIRRDRDRFFEMTSDLVLVTDFEGRMIEISPSWARTLGRPLEEIVSRPFLDFVLPVDRASTEEIFGRQLTGVEVHGWANRYVGPHGDVRWLEWSSIPDLSAKRVYAVARDISDRRQAEEGLARLAAIIESSSDAIYATDTEDRITAWNDAAQRMFGYEQREVLGEHATITSPPDKRQDQYRHAVAAMAGNPQSFESVRQRKDGSLFRAEATLFPITAPGGRIAGLSTILRDVTERYEAREKLSEQAGLLELAHDAIIVRTLDGTIRYWNAGAERTYGWTASEAAGQVTHLLLQTVFPDSLDALNAALATRGEWEGELTHKHRDGRTIVVQSRQVVEGAESGDTGVLEINRDVTDAVASQRRLEEYAEDLRRSNEELEQFAYVASHDLQEPLRMVSGFVGLLQRRYGDKLGAEADEYIEFATEGARRMQTLINDLLTFSRVGTRAQEPERTDLNEVADEALINLRASIEETAAEVQVDRLPTVRADRHQMVQLLQNLIGNAVKFRTEVPPSIHVGAQRDRNAWRVFVRDNGIGISPEHQEQIFVIFRRLHSREAYPGTGIGLAICKKIVERHGGRIWVESKPGEGSTFWFTIPADRERYERGE